MCSFVETSTLQISLDQPVLYKGLIRIEFFFFFSFFSPNIVEFLAGRNVSNSFESIDIELV